MKNLILHSRLIIFLQMAWCISTCEPSDHKINTCGDGEISATDAVWSHGEGDLQNSKRASDIRQKGCFTGPQTTPQIQWSFDLGGPGTAAAPVIGDDGTIYIVGEYPGTPKGGGIRNSGLMAISPQGSLKWFFSNPVDIGNSFSAIYNKSVSLGTDGTIYIALYDSNFYALNADGSVKWSRRLINHVSPAIDNQEQIYVGKDTVYCIKKDGNLAWKFVDVNLTGELLRRIVLGKRHIYCGFLDKGILALDYLGHKQWFYELDYQNFLQYGILLDEEENLYFKTNDNNIRSVDKNGSLRWTGNVGIICGMSEPVLRGDYLYFGSFGGVFKLDKKTGTQITTLAALPQGWYVNSYTSPLIDDNGTIYIGSGYGGLTAVTKDGDKLWEIAIPQADQTEFWGYIGLSPEGTLYIATFDDVSQAINRLYAIY